MNKLVSKNPIQRFKLGQKIEKLYNGGWAGYYTPGNWPKSGNQLTIPSVRKKSNNSISVTTPTHDWGQSSYGSNKINTARAHNYGRGEVEYKKDTNGQWMARYTSPLAKDQNWYYVAEGSTGYDSSGNYNKYVNGQWVKIKNSSPKTDSVSTSKQTIRKPAAVTKPAVVNKLSVVPKTSFYGQGIGGTVLASGNNFNGLISDDARNKLIATGKFDNNSFSSVQNFQTALNNYFANDGAGSITVDDKWGNQTQKAFDLALAKAGESHGQTFNPNVNQYNNTIETPLSTVSYGYTPTEKIQVTTPQRIYNREDVRDFIRSRRKNAYGFSGAQRRALRMVLNGQGTDTDRAIVSGMGIFKKGGLISKNPIKRFKSNFR